jgi:hypothetical protein
MLNRVLDHFDIDDKGIRILPWKSHIYCIFFEVVDVPFVLLERRVIKNFENKIEFSSQKLSHTVRLFNLLFL